MAGIIPMRMKLLLVVALFSVVECYDRYEVPAPLIEVFNPKGLRVSIPDDEGVTLFAFHGLVNEEFESGREAGDTGLSKDVLRERNGRWTFINRDIALRKGDKLNYWLYVIKDGIGHERLFQTHTVLGYSRPIQELRK